MKSVFLSHKFTGLSFEEMDFYLRPVVDAFTSRGVKVFSSLYQENWFQSMWWDATKIYDRCGKHQLEYDTTLGLAWSEQESYGMKLELGIALDNNKQYMFLYKDELAWLARVQEFISKSHHSQDFVDIPDLLQCLNFLPQIPKS